MDPITIHIHVHGDLCITSFPEPDSLPEESGEQLPPGGRIVESRLVGYTDQSLTARLEKYLEYVVDGHRKTDNGTPDEDIDPIVLVMCPSKPPLIMTESECFREIEQHGEYYMPITIDTPKDWPRGMKGAYDDSTVLHLGSVRYLLGPAIVYGCDPDGDSISLTAGQLLASIVWFTNRTVTLCADGKDLPAFRL